MLSELLQQNPVVITGCGAVTAAGLTVPELWDRACAGRAAADWLPHRDRAGRPYAGCAIGALPDDAPGTRRLDRSTRLGLLAARQALRQARLEVCPVPARRLGVVAATSRGPVGQLLEAAQMPPDRRFRPSLALNAAVAALSGAISAELAAEGPCLTVSATCASSAAALALAAQQLVLGAADLMLAGGAEAPLLPLVLGPLQAMGLLGSHDQPQKVCRPFDVSRNGTVLGEGAGFLALETLASARRRGVQPLARLAGWAIAADTRHRAGLDETGENLARTLQEAIHLAGLAPAQISHLNTHGTGTRANDLAEARALRRVFGNAPLCCAATKPVTGHCLGAGAAIEAILAIEALRHQTVPPTANCDQPDPQCALDLARNQPRPWPIPAAMSVSAGLWGTRAALVFTPA